MKSLIFLFAALAFAHQAHADEVLERKLGLIKQAFQLELRGCVADTPKKAALSQQAQLGKALFESKALSGNRDTSCSTCHLDDHALTDGLPLAVGVGGSGEGPDRMKDGQGIIVARNAFTLFGRGMPDFQSFFWDGKIQVEGDRIVMPFGDDLKGFNSGLAAAAILPIIERDEFIGVLSHFSPNDIEYNAAHLFYKPRYAAVEDALQKRLSVPVHPLDRELADQLTLLGVVAGGLKLTDIGNAIAEFISSTFPCKRTRWDEYLEGNESALSENEKAGMVLFYGRGRCVSCHAGRVGSDFRNHSLGVPQGRFSPHSRNRDLGRAGVTQRAEDLYRFRTPPLLSVATTAPYGHNGIFETLDEVVRHHFDPVAIYVLRPEVYESERNVVARTMDTRSPLLPAIELPNDRDMGSLLAFLRLL